MGLLAGRRVDFLTGQKEAEGVFPDLDFASVKTKKHDQHCPLIQLEAVPVYFKRSNQGEFGRRKHAYRESCFTGGI